VNEKALANWGAVAPQTNKQTNKQIQNENVDWIHVGVKGPNNGILRMFLPAEQLLTTEGQCAVVLVPWGTRYVVGGLVNREI